MTTTIPRDACKAHNKTEVLDHPPQVNRPLLHPQLQLPPPPPTPAQPATQHISIPTNIAQPETTLRPKVATTNAKGKLVGALSKSKGSCTLSQPMSTDWLQSYTVAADQRSEDGKRRQERQEMLERQKREVRFIVWYNPTKQPYRITHSIQHYPHTSLSAISPLILNLKLSDKSYIELYDSLTQSWTNITSGSEFDVDKERTTLIWVGSSLRNILDPADCEGLQLQLDLQPHYWRGTKRAAEQLTSPVKRLRADSSDVRTQAPVSTVPLRVSLSSLPCPVSPVISPTSVPSTPSSAPTVPVPSQLSVVNEASPQSPLPLPPLSVPLSSRQAQNVARDTSKADKRFPINYSVAFFGIGIRKIMHEKADDPKATEANLYSKHFGFEYRKSSAVNYKKKWNDASKALQDEFIALGNMGTWAEFRHRIDLEKSTQSVATPSSTTATSIISTSSDDSIPAQSFYSRSHVQESPLPAPPASTAF
ncbi:hypothetical protein AAF712_007458 [Marasmius tenuissimus]|uniref:HMG box domain-containing protein n=1 Tax=Marasmius tenuissimus TaxID=585030 RepID=A0ABR2ZZ13_9AGAR